jgi:hypothetical protein
MDQIQPIPKYHLDFVAIKDDRPVKFNITITIPCQHQCPLPGDEVLQLPQATANAAGFDKNVFKVESRRFIFDSIEPGTTGTIFLRIS